MTHIHLAFGMIRQALKRHVLPVLIFDGPPETLKRQPNPQLITAAQMLYERALELATASDGQRQPIAGLAMIGLGRVQREWNDPDGAARYLTEGIELAQKWGETSVVQGYVDLAYVRQAQGDDEGARGALKTAQRLATSPMRCNRISPTSLCKKCAWNLFGATSRLRHAAPRRTIWRDVFARTS